MSSTDIHVPHELIRLYSKSNFLLAAPPARYSLPAAPTIPSSKDLLQWMPTPDVYASLHIPSLTATSITQPSTVTATWNSTTSSMRLEYPTKDIDVREELINPATSILMYLVAYGTFTIAIACCSVYLVLKRHQRGRILVRALVVCLILWSHCCISSRSMLRLSPKLTPAHFHHLLNSSFSMVGMPRQTTYPTPPDKSPIYLHSGLLNGAKVSKPFACLSL